jgi:hypothetical protein
MKTPSKKLAQYKKPTVKMTDEQFAEFMRHPDWEQASDARKIVGYQMRAFYDVLAKQIDGSPLITSMQVSVPGKKPMIFVYKPSLPAFIRNDLKRVRKEARRWILKHGRQDKNLPILEEMYPNA